MSTPSQTTGPNSTAPRPALLLHAGAPKTGTTAIQSALAHNRARLEAAGVWYPPISDTFPVNPRLNSARAHFAFAAAVARDTEEDRQRVARFMAAMEARGGTVDRVILSAETLYRLTAGSPKGAGRESPLDKRHRFLARLAAVTEEFRAEVLLYLRRVDRFAESLYAETMVQTAQSWGFSEFLDKLAPRFDYRLQIDCFAAHFPTRVRSFDAAAKAGLLTAFAADAGLPGTLDAPDDRNRPSISNTAALWLREAKLTAPDMTARERAQRWHFALRPEHADLFDGQRRSALWESRDQRDRFIERNQSRVGEITFPPAEANLAPRADWSPERHRETERKFARWRRRNLALLLKRRLKRTPPFVLDD